MREQHDVSACAFVSSVLCVSFLPLAADVARRVVSAGWARKHTVLRRCNSATVQDTVIT